MEKKAKQLRAVLHKADKDYTEASYKAESARQDWDLTVAKVQFIYRILKFQFIMQDPHEAHLFYFFLIMTISFNYIFKEINDSLTE